MHFELNPASSRSLRSEMYILRSSIYFSDPPASSSLGPFLPTSFISHPVGPQSLRDSAITRLYGRGPDLDADIKTAEDSVKSTYRITIGLSVGAIALVLVIASILVVIVLWKARRRRLRSENDKNATRAPPARLSPCSSSVLKEPGSCATLIAPPSPSTSEYQHPSFNWERTGQLSSPSTETLPPIPQLSSFQSPVTPAVLTPSRMSLLESKLTSSISGSTVDISLDIAQPSQIADDAVEACAPDPSGSPCEPPPAYDE